MFELVVTVMVGGLNINCGGPIVEFDHSLPEVLVLNFSLLPFTTFFGGKLFDPFYSLVTFFVDNKTDD